MTKLEVLFMALFALHLTRVAAIIWFPVKSSFADRWRPLSGTDAIAIPPGSVIASDNLPRLA